MKPRTKARSIALQALFEIDLTGHLPGSVLEQRLEENPLNERELIGFASEITQGVINHRASLDNLIAEYAPDWPLDQVASIDRNILRMALWEMAIQTDTPVKVVINEAVELSKAFGSESTPRFVNGVLGSLADQLNEIRQDFHQLIKEK
ncbi:MAG: transcription antitermination factor NusB [Anaerolineaceae bacterium]|nr:transcription antitermination factor NusB [Anaerolineaceae bacterium]